MNKIIFITVIIMLSVQCAFCEGFENISPADPFAPVVENNSISIPVKKAVLTHNDLYNQYVLAFDRFMQSNTKSAYNDFKMLINTMNSNDYAYMKLAENMADIGFFNLSDSALSKVSDKNLSDYLSEDINLFYSPSKKLKPDDEIYLGEVYANIIYNDQSREATEELVKNTDLLAKSDYANYICALGYLKSNDFINAEVYINRAIGMNSQNLNYKKLRAEIIAQSKNPKNAKKIIDNLKAQNLYTADFIRKINSAEQYVLYKSQKNYPEKMFHLGYYYYFENEYVKSIRTLQNAFSQKKKLNKDVYAVLSRVYYDSKDYEKAQDCALKAQKLDGKNTIALLVLGDLSYRKNELKTALKYYKDASMNDKNSSLPQLRIALVYEQTDKTKKAREIYERLLKTYNDCYTAYYKIALFDKSRELTYLKKAIALNFNFKDAWIDLARYAIEHDDDYYAKNCLKVAGYIDENDFRYYYYQGILAKKQGLDGTSYFKKSLLINPDYQPAKEELKI